MNPNLVELMNPDPSSTCVFCGRHAINSVEWGPMYKLGDVVLHYFCMLFSSGLVQLGKDNEGVLGFLPKDIKKEISRGKKLKCKFCRQGTATVGCVVAKCKSSFHYPCGLENGTLHQFAGHFASYCQKHKARQNIPRHAEWVCPICMVEVDNEVEAVWPPCCGKSVFHRRCIMHAAKEAGYFFKCPLCNCTDEFLEAMKANGVYVPEQDAAWETVPGAYAELTEHYMRCDAEICLCPDGRNFDNKENRNWKIVRCSGCGASAIHVMCGDLHVYSWKCSTCENVLKKMSTEPQAVSSGAIPSVSVVPASGAAQRNLGNEDTSSESESESTESEDSSESPDSDAGSGIARNVQNATTLIRMRRQQIETDTDTENEDEIANEVPLVWNKHTEKVYRVIGDVDELSTASCSPTGPSTSNCTNNYNNQGELLLHRIPSPSKSSKQKFQSPLNRIRNPHLHSTPTLCESSHILRQSHHIESSEMQDLDGGREKSRHRLNPTLSAKQLVIAKSKISYECRKQALLKAHRPSLDITTIPRIPKLSEPPVFQFHSERPEQESQGFRVEAKTNPEFNRQGKFFAQSKLDKWLIVGQKNESSHIQVSELMQSQTQDRVAIRNSGCRNSNSSSSWSESSSENRNDIDDENSIEFNSEISGTSTSSSETSSTVPVHIIAELKSKSKVRRDKFKKPNKSQHVRALRFTPDDHDFETVIPILKTKDENSNSDSDIELLEEKESSPHKISEYATKKYESIPKSSAFLSMVAGSENKLLGILGSNELSPIKVKSEDVDMIELLSSDEDQGDALASTSSSGNRNSGLGLGLRTTVIPGTYFFQNSTLRGQIPHDYWFNSTNMSCMNDSLKNLYASLYPGCIKLPETVVMEDKELQKNTRNLRKLSSRVAKTQMTLGKSNEEEGTDDSDEDYNYTNTKRAAKKMGKKGKGKGLKKQQKRLS